MKNPAIYLVLALVALSAVAWRWQPSDVSDKPQLIWVSDDNPARREQIALFNKLNPDISLKLDPANIGVEKVIVQCLGGVGPDLFDCASTSDLATFVQAGIAWDVTDELRKMGLDPQKEVWPGLAPIGTLDGRSYGFGCNIAADAIWFNKDIFDEEGVPYPTGSMTWDEFIELAKRMTKRDSKGRVVRYGFMSDWWNWQNFTRAFGGSVYSDDLTRSTMSDEKNVQAVQFMQDLIYKHKVAPSPVDESAMATQGGWGSGTITYFGGGKSAMAIGGRWWLTTLRKYDKLRLGVFERPSNGVAQVRAYGRVTLINAKSPRRQEALRFLMYQAGREYNELINAQADGLGPRKEFAYTDSFLHNPAFPLETDNGVWRKSAENAIADQVSPYVSADVVGRIITKQMDLIKANQKSAVQGLRDADREIQERMHKELRDNPALREKWETATGRKL